jgi:hypothetical protein
MTLTPEFPPEILPVREGVYLTKQIDTLTGTVVSKQTEYSLFDVTSKIWGCGHATPEEAAKKPDYEFAWQYKSWQGLAEEPKS